MSRRTPVESADKRAVLGHPSQVWTPGLERRLSLIRRYVDLRGKRILDVGCGVGAFVRRFSEFSDRVYGFDIDREHVLRGAEEVPNLALAVGEHLPYRDETFDVILMHEVLEHVDDDLATLRETHRVLATGGSVVIFCPNRLYPFETHGIFLGEKYVFGNIPLVNYLPDAARNRLVPHARAYTTARLRSIYRQAGFRARIHSYVYPGFDHIAVRRPLISKTLKTVMYPLENTSLRIFGLSHFVVLVKGQPTRG